MSILASQKRNRQGISLPATLPWLISPPSVPLVYLQPSELLSLQVTIQMLRAQDVTYTALAPQPCHAQELGRAVGRAGKRARPPKAGS